MTAKETTNSTDMIRRSPDITTRNSMALTDQPPRVSVIIPVFNGEQYLADAIESVCRQQHHPLEIIVVDDGSTDNTAHIAQRFQPLVRYIYQPNQGPAVARNTGMKAAEGHMIGFLDADDRWKDNRLNLQLMIFANNPQAEVVIGHSQLLAKAHASDGATVFQPYSEAWLFLNFGSAIYRKSVFEKVGVGNESLFYADDLDWFMRAREKQVHIIVHKDIVLLHRRHERNLTNNKILDQAYILEMLKKSLNRRRSQADGGTPIMPQFSSFLARPAKMHEHQNKENTPG
jgi:glycosyltransferase involved in cell wall biosynthesis